MHWLADEIENLRQLAQEQSGVRGGRGKVIKAITRLVEDIGARDDVKGSFASHDGFLLAFGGMERGRAESLAAIAQMIVDPALTASGRMEFGDLQQVLIVADQEKLALLQSGTFTIGIVAKRQTHLGQSLSQKQ
ncbi:MAG: roadblock/LC7 domain-containing protein [Deltaproteobacteria bacterium]|nr:roadblock/LC7 domain-containing protein [Deltaproteobacteria bacterium]